MSGVRIRVAAATPTLYYTKTSELINDSGFVNAAGAAAAAPVQSVSGKSGAVTLSKSDVGLGNVDNVRQYSASNPPPYPVTSVNGETGAVTVPVPTKTSDLTNDSGYQTAAQVSAAVDAEATARATSDAALDAKIDNAFIHCTASGNPAAFDDGADGLPVKELVVSLPYSAAGYTGCTVRRCGKNLLRRPYKDDNGPGGATVYGITFTVNTDGSITAQGTATTTANYYFSRTNEEDHYRIGSGSFSLAIPASNSGALAGVHFQAAFIVDGNTEKIISLPLQDGTTYRAFSGDVVLRHCRIYVSSGTVISTPITFYPQIEFGTAVTDYEPYQEQTVTVDWTETAGTVYGGTFDVATGVLTSTLDENGDPLAEPVSYQLAPAQLTTLAGHNAVYADTGDAAVTYRADPKLYVDRRVAELTAAIVSLGGNV